MGLWGCGAAGIARDGRWDWHGLDSSGGDTGWGLEGMVSGLPGSLLGWGHGGRGPGAAGAGQAKAVEMSADTSERVSERAPTNVTDSKR